MKQIKIMLSDEQEAALQAEASKSSKTAEDLATKLMSIMTEEMIVAARREAIYAPVLLAKQQGAEAERAARQIAEEQEENELGKNHVKIQKK